MLCPASCCHCWHCHGSKCPPSTAASQPSLPWSWPELEENKVLLLERFLFPSPPLICIHLPGEVEAAAADIGAGSVSYVNARVCESRPLTPGWLPASIPVSPARGLESIPVPPVGMDPCLHPGDKGCCPSRDPALLLWGHPDFPHTFHLEFPGARPLR